MKRLLYIFIPVLAVLLMSHNTFATGNKFTPTTCYHTTAGNNYCQNYPLYTGDTVDIISISRANNTDLSNTTNGEHYLWALSVRAYGNVPANFSINLANGYPDMATVDNIWQSCNTANQLTTCNILVDGTLMRWNWNIQLAGQVTAFGTIYELDSLYFSTDIGTDIQILNRLTRIQQYLENNPSPSAQDIADAVNGQQEAAGQTQSDAGDTAADNSDQAVDNATQSLFSAMGTVVSALRDTPASDCLITVSSVGSSQVFTSAIGQLNVCSVPSGILAIVQGLAALVIVPMVLMACYSLLHKIYNAFKEVQDT